VYARHIYSMHNSCGVWTYLMTGVTDCQYTDTPYLFGWTYSQCVAMMKQ